MKRFVFASLAALCIVSACTPTPQKFGIVTPPERTVSAPPNIVDGGLAAQVGFQVGDPLGTAAWVKYGPGNQDWQSAPTGRIINANAITAYCVNTANATTPGSNSNTGDCTHPLLTLSELANRLAYARIEVPITITVTGNAAAGDTPHWTFTTSDAIAFGITGIIPVQIIGVPTVLYTGTATTVVTITAGATATDNEITDTAVPTSYTASGMLATGVLFKRTNSTALYWFAAKDLTGKTARISQPMSTTTFADAALTTNDAYTAYTLPVGQQMTFAYSAPGTIAVEQMAFVTGYHANDWGVYYINDWFVGTSLLSAANGYMNCAMGGSTTFNGSQGPQDIGLLIDGMMRGSGSTSMTVFGAFGFETLNRFTVQGAQLVVQFGTMLIQNDIAINDCTAAGGCVVATTNAGVQWQGFFQGQGNASLVSAKQNSTFVLTQTTPFVAGSSSDTTTSIKSTGTASTNVAGYTSGNTVLNTSGNGIYKTQ